MKKKRNQHLLLISTLFPLFYLMQTSLELSDVASGILAGIGFGLAVLGIIVARKNIKRPQSFKENIKRKLLNN